MILANIGSEMPDSINIVKTFINNGGVFMLCLIFLSIVSLTVILLKCLTLKSSKVIPRPVQRAMKNASDFIDKDDISGLNKISEPKSLSTEIRSPNHVFT